MGFQGMWRILCLYEKRGFLLESNVIAKSELMRKKILITGAGGYIGRHVVKAAIETGLAVLACDIKPSGVDSRAEIIETDIFNNPQDIYERLGSPDICLHLAWKDGFSHNSDSHMETLSSHYSFIRNMLNGGLTHLAVLGTMHEVGYHEGAIDENTPCNPRSKYGIAKDALRRSVFLLAEERGACLQWLRAYYIYGDDLRNQSIFTKLLLAATEGKKTFPLNSGKNLYDFIRVEDLAHQIAAAVNQTAICGIIECCSGKPVSLGEKVEAFIKENEISIDLEYGAFPDRPYDSPGAWGCTKRIEQLMFAMRGK